MKIQEAFQNKIDTLFFRGKNPLWAKRVAYGIENVFLMAVIFFLLLNTLLYNWTGGLYKEGTGSRLDWVFHGLDNAIPFVPETAIFYIYLFYSAVPLSMVYFALIDSEKGYALSWTLVVINAVAIIVYIFFPVSTYWFRTELLAHPLSDNAWAKVMYDYYTTDTSFNCFPSLHAAVSTAIAYTWFRYARLKQSAPRIIVAIAAIVIAAGVILSTLFVRQHYIADEIAGILLAYITAKIIINRLWKPFLKSKTRSV